jgi:hypothetical protein
VTAMAPSSSAAERVRIHHRNALGALTESGCSFLVGGAYAFARHTGLRSRPVKDLDVFVRRDDVPKALTALRRAGWTTKLAFPHWLAKALRGGEFVDVIFASGNGEVSVDDEWFDHAKAGRLLHVPVRFCPPEEEIWMRSFVMERVRYDGADVAHLVRACGETLDWRRLLARFGAHWRVLLSHLVLFEFIYPAERTNIPRWIMDELGERLAREREDAHRGGERVCRGTLLSRVEYQVDVGVLGYEDARVVPRGHMSPDDARSWTRAGFQDVARRANASRADRRRARS